jgi:hypothetical protein
MANWARTVRRLRRMANELRAYDFQVIEPDGLDTPPGQRNGLPAQS